MTTILSWNIQNGLGVDGALSLKRIAYAIKDICDPDVICLQEVSVNMLLPDGSFDDQVSALVHEFKGYTPFFGIAMDTWNPEQSGRGQYGNLILSRYPVRSAFAHPLPQPADGAKKQMPRQMTEVTVDAPSGPLRVMTTHLEFHSQIQRLAQSKRMMAIDTDVRLLEQEPPLFVSDSPYGRFERASKSVLCGDFNFLAESEEYNAITQMNKTESGFHDAWLIANPDQPYAPTCGIFDEKQWPEGPHCRDFMFVSDELTNGIERMFVDTTTNASDHQPLLIELKT
jgi:endonuclease/exonuclease/phosphatase family metal-dependent hydrolase